MLTILSSLIVCPAHAEEAIKFNYKLGMDSDSLFDTMYGYSGGTSETPSQPNISKAYVEGKYGKALRITYHGFKINNAAKRYNAYLFKFKQSDISCGDETMKMLDLMRDTNTISMYVHTPETVDHTGSGAAGSRTLEMIFEFATNSGNKKYSKKFQLPNTGEWAYISLPTSVFTGGGTNMKDGIQDGSYTSAVSMSISFPYKDYFGANPDDSTWESPWDEPLIIDELLFDRSTETCAAVNPPSVGEEAYHENTDIKAVYVDGYEASGFDKSSEINEIQIPSYIKPEDIAEHITVVPEAQEIKKTNTNQAVSGATYELSLPSALPGTGSITVTSASGKARKTYSVRFVQRDGIKVLKDKISGSVSESVTIPILNESAQKSAAAAVIAAVSDKKSGKIIRACLSDEKTIKPGESVDFNLDVNAAADENAEFFIVDNLSDLSLCAAPFTVPYSETSSFSSGALSSLSVGFSEKSGKISVSALPDGGGGFIIIKKDNEIIGARCAAPNGKNINEEILIGEENCGEISVIITHSGGRYERSFYYASAERIDEFMLAYKNITEKTALGFYSEYGQLLNIPDKLWSGLSDDEKIKVLYEADKEIDNIEQVRTEVSRRAALENVNRCSASVLTMLFNEYNDILCFDTSMSFYDEYVKNNVSAVLSAVAAKKYDSLEEANRAFFENSFIYAINSAESYARIGEILESSAAAVGELFDYRKYNSLTASEKADYLSYVSKMNITSFDMLSGALTGYKKGASSSGATVSGKGSENTAVSVPKSEIQKNENEEKTVFADVPVSHWAYGAVQGLYVQKIADGISEGYFGADEAITREQFIKLLLGAAQINHESAESAGFSDVDENMWYAPYINSAAEKGIVSGISEGLFGTGRNITRGDMAVFIARALSAKGISLPDGSGNLFDDDGEIPDYAKRSVYALRALGLADGMGDNMYCPSLTASRAQSAKLLYGVYTYVTDKAAEDVSAYSALYKKLNALGLVEISKNSSDIVSRGEFAAIMASFMNKSGRSGSGTVYADVPDGSRWHDDIMFLYENGASDAGGSVFRPDEPIVLSEALCMLLKALGYSDALMPENESAYASALRYKIIGSDFAFSDSPMTFDAVLKLIDSAKDAEVVRADYSENPTSFERSDDSALYFYKKILTAEGVLNGAGIRSVDNSQSADNQTVRIGGSIYECADKEAYRNLGCTVKGYFHEKDEEIIYLEATDKNKIVKIGDESAEAFDGTRLTWRDGSSRRSADIPKSARLMKNHNYISRLSESDYLNADEIILIDNNRDGAYEAVNLIEEKTYFVNQVSSDGTAVYDYYENAPLKTDGTAVINVYDASLNTIAFGDIQVNDVLSVRFDVKGESAAVYLSRKRDEGTVKETGESGGSKYAKIGEQRYILSKNTAESPSEMKKLTVGSGVTVYLDCKNKISHVSYNYKLSELDFGYIVKVIAPDTEDEPSVKMYTAGGALTTVPLATKATVNGKRITSADMLEEELKKANINSSVIYQLVKFKKSSDGKIKEIKCADYVDDNALYTSSSEFTRYHDLIDSYYHMLYKAYVGYVRMAEDTLIINVPYDKDDMNNSTLYDTVSFSQLKSSTHKQVEIYNMSDDKTAGIAVIHSDGLAGAELNSNSTAMVIKEIGEVSTDDGNRVSLTVLYNGEEKQYMLSEDCSAEREYISGGSSAVSVLDKGDVIRAGFNGNGEINDYHKIFDLSGDDDPKIVARGAEAENAREYYGSKRNLIAYWGNALGGNDDVLCGRLWEGNNNSAWFAGVKCSFEFGYAKEVHNNTIILGVYPGSDADNRSAADRYLNLKNRRVYIIDEINDEIKLGTPEDIISAQYAGETGASRIIAERHSDVASCVIIVKRKRG